MITFEIAGPVTSDPAISSGEWAGVRESTKAERRILNAGSKAICHTFFIRGCGAFIRLVVADTTPRPSFFRRLSLASSLRKVVEKRSPGIEQAYSTAVFATAMALAPGATEALRALRDEAAVRRCARCACVMRPGGPLDPESIQGQFVAGQIAELAKGMAA
jgi:hypothetical protein